MQKCGQLHASIAVALIAQCVGDDECPTLTQSRAMARINALLCIGAPPFGESMRLSRTGVQAVGVTNDGKARVQ